MPPGSTAIDWQALKPDILRLLSIGKTRKDVAQEISRDGTSITKSQLEYQLKCWGMRANLTQQAWRYASHKVQKRARSKKASAVIFNGALIPDAKVVKETRRHDRPTLLQAPGASPTCPEGIDLVICTPPSLAESSLRNASTEVQHSPLGPIRPISSLPWMKFVRELQWRMSHLCFLCSNIV
ncbi:hypothetical protein F5883DRAFT_97450 [Diaporthe sp. PMI_573]|nr:hypothetical protein F5883DRAFT_97450 [Diaporthaceae sp. PMI_573]